MPKNNEVLTSLSTAEKINEFFANVTFAGTEFLNKASKAIELIANIESLDNIAAVIKLLIASKKQTQGVG